MGAHDWARRVARAAVGAVMALVLMARVPVSSGEVGNARVALANHVCGHAQAPACTATPAVASPTPVAAQTATPAPTAPAATVTVTSVAATGTPTSVATSAASSTPAGTPS